MVVMLSSVRRRERRRMIGRNVVSMYHLLRLPCYHILLNIVVLILVVQALLVVGRVESDVLNIVVYSTCQIKLIVPRESFQTL